MPDSKYTTHFSLKEDFCGTEMRWFHPNSSKDTTRVNRIGLLLIGETVFSSLNV